MACSCGEYVTSQEARRRWDAAGDGDTPPPEAPTPPRWIWAELCSSEDAVEYLREQLAFGSGPVYGLVTETTPPKIVAVTGNGPHSLANAKWIMEARGHGAPPPDTQARDRCPESDVRRFEVIHGLGALEAAHAVLDAVGVTGVEFCTACAHEPASSREDRCSECGEEGVMSTYYGNPDSRLRENDLAEIVSECLAAHGLPRAREPAATTPSGTEPTPPPEALTLEQRAWAWVSSSDAFLQANPRISHTRFAQAVLDAVIAEVDVSLHNEDGKCICGAVRGATHFKCPLSGTMDILKRHRGES